MEDWQPSPRQVSNGQIKIASKSRHIKSGTIIQTFYFDHHVIRLRWIIMIFMSRDNEILNIYHVMVF